MGGGTKYGSEKDHTGHIIFAYQKKDDKKWGMVMTLASALRTSLEGYSKRELRIMPLVCCSIAGMGVCYSYIPDEMIARVIPAEVLEICESPRMEFELGTPSSTSTRRDTCLRTILECALRRACRPRLRSLVL